MIVYNVTVNVDHDVHDEWLKWMKEVHIPDVMATGFFTENRMFRLLVDEEQGTSYSIQYTCDSIEQYNSYREQHAPRLQKEVADRYKDKFVAFRTLLERV